MSSSSSTTPSTPGSSRPCTPDTDPFISSRCPSPTTSESAVVKALTQEDNEEDHAFPKIPTCKHCDQPTDTILRSRSGILIGAHSSQLKSHSPDGLWAHADSSFALGEPVQMAYEADVLNLLMHWIHPKWPPELDRISFDLLKRVAEAVETYRIYCARESVKLAMNIPRPVFAYAVKYDHRHLVQLSLHMSMKTPLTEMRAALVDRPDLFIAWMFYRTKRMEEKQDIYHRLVPSASSCGTECRLRWLTFKDSVHDVAFTTPGLPATLAQFDRATAEKDLLEACEGCVNRVDEWRKTVKETIESRESFWEYVAQEEEEMF
ncbi:hypothetical protein VNI00_016284 [Paramarasmius palmivorus]|uniref:Uncharacterized protein n=1 Tax=Paramarasmius palmivorus TaxID=297713 RepID=A0AAW0BD10_9AGAR